MKCIPCATNIAIAIVGLVLIAGSLRAEGLPEEVASGVARFGHCRQPQTVALAAEILEDWKRHY